jgi:hypothetical protein
MSSGAGRYLRVAVIAAVGKWIRTALNYCFALINGGSLAVPGWQLREIVF